MTKKTRLLVAAIPFILCSTAALAQGDFEKAARVEAEKNIQLQIKDLKTKCGLPKLDMSVDWNAYTQQKEYAQSTGRSLADALRLASGHTGQFVSALIELCEDKEFKAEIIKVSAIQFKPMKSPGVNAVVKKSGSKILIDGDLLEFGLPIDVKNALGKIF